MHCRILPFEEVVAGDPSFVPGLPHGALVRLIPLKVYVERLPAALITVSEGISSRPLLLQELAFTVPNSANKREKIKLLQDVTASFHAGQLTALVIALIKITLISFFES